MKKKSIVTYQDMNYDSQLNTKKNDEKTNSPIVTKLIDVIDSFSNELLMRLDTQFSEICSALIEQRQDDIFKIKPSTAILEYQSDFFEEGSIVLEKGSILNCRDKLREYQFITLDKLLINPIIIEEVSKGGEEEDNSIIVHFKFVAPIDKNELDILRLYIGADKEISWSIVGALLLEETSFYIDVRGIKQEKQKIDIRYPLFEEGKCIAEKCIRQFFRKDESYQFFEMDVSQVQWGNSETFSFIIETKNKINLIDQSLFCLHCVKVENRHQKLLEPVRIDGSKIEYKLNIDIDVENEALCDILTIKSDQENVILRPFEKYNKHLQDVTYYRVSNQLNNEQKYQIVLSGKDALIPQTLSIKAEVCSVTLEIEKNSAFEIRLTDGQSLSFISKTSMTPPYYLEDKRKSDKVFSFYLNEFELEKMNLDTLKNYLSNLIHHKDDLEEIEAIIDLKLERRTDIVLGCWEEQLLINLVMHKNKTQHVGRLMLFARVLHEYFVLASKPGKRVITGGVIKNENKTFLWG